MEQFLLTLGFPRHEGNNATCVRPRRIHTLLPAALYTSSGKSTKIVPHANGRYEQLHLTTTVYSVIHTNRRQADLGNEHLEQFLLTLDGGMEAKRDDGILFGTIFVDFSLGGTTTDST